MKRNSVDVNEFVEKKLDQISKAGEWVGNNIGGIGRGMKNVIIALGALVIFGVAVFLWAVGKGLVKKR